MQQNRLFALCAALVLIPLATFLFGGQAAGTFSLGLVFLAGVVWLVFGRNKLTDAQAQLVRTLTAVAAGAAAAFIPGFLQFDLGGKDYLVRAGGGLAVFVLIYWRVPAK